MRKALRKTEENLEEKWGKLWRKMKLFLGKVSKIMKIDEENFRKSEESYEDRRGKF